MMSDTQFYAYAGLLVFTGLLMLVLAGTGFGQEKSTRIVNALAGLGFAGYGGYLLLFFTGGEVQVFWYVLILPVLLLIQAVRTFLAKRKAGATEPAPEAAP